jgi:hypothetical protein
MTQFQWQSPDAVTIDNLIMATEWFWHANEMYVIEWVIVGWHAHRDVYNVLMK